MQQMHMPLHKAFNPQPHRLPVSRHFRLLHHRLRLINFRPAILTAERPRPRIHRPRLRLPSRRRIHWLRKRHREPVRLRPHLMHLKRHLPSPHHSVQAPRLPAARTPSPITPTRKEMPLRRLHHPDQPRTEALTEHEHRALIQSVDLLQIHALNVAVALLRHKHLVLKRPELAPG